MPALGDSPSAGFVIQDKPAIFYKGGVILPKPLDIKVSGIHGFNITPLSIVRQAKPGEIIAFRHVFENLGNSSEWINFKVKSAPPDSDVKIMAEDQELGGRMPVQEGAIFNIWVVFKTPDSAPLKKSYDVELMVTGQVKDGDAYYGFDGQLHGGKDEFTLTDRIQL